MNPPSAASVSVALAEDLQLLAEKYRSMLQETFVGLGLCLSDYEVGSLAMAAQEGSQPLNAPMAMAAALLLTALESETNPQVSALAGRAQRLVRTAIELKTGQLLATNSLH